MMMILNDSDLDRLPSMKIALDAVEQAFAEQAAGKLVSPPRHHVSIGELGALVFTVGGSSGETPLAGFRVYDTFRGQEHSQITAAWSADTAELQGVILGSRLGPTRTGAIGGIAIKYMSSPAARTAGIIGSGNQARAQLQAAACVRDLTSAKVFSRNERNRKLFATEMTEYLGIPVHAMPSARQAVEDAEIVICATNSPKPVLDASWLKEGVHVNTVGPKTIDRHELGLDVAERADIIATDSAEQAGAYGSPFFLTASDKKLQLNDLATIVTGHVVPRIKGGELTLFCSVGLAGTEVFVASALLAAAAESRESN